MICPSCAHDNVPGNEYCENCHQSLSSLDLPTPSNEIQRSLMEDTVAHLKPNPPVIIRAETTIPEVIQLMLDRTIGAVLVEDEQGNLLGIFSERDLLKKITGSFDNYDGLKVGDFMTTKPVTVTLNHQLNFVLHQMDVGGYRHMPVVSEEGKPIGMVSIRDMLKHITNICDNHGH